MEITAYRLLYDNIHDFKAAAVHVDSETRRLGIRSESRDEVPGMGGRIHHAMWVSMKTVSHFNLGIALELMLKLLLVLNRKSVPRDHHLANLHDSLPTKIRRQLEDTYNAIQNTWPQDIELVAFIGSATPTPPDSPPNRNIESLSGFLEYLDQDVMLWQKRYSWELVDKGCWRHYLNDISVFIELIERVMRDIPRK